MTELAYMMREDWGRDRTAMVTQSSAVRDWVGSAPYLFAVMDAKRFDQNDRAADIEAAEYIAPDKSERVVFGISELADLGRDNKVIEHAVVVLHPFEQRKLETLRRAVEANSVGKLFVLIWSRHDIIRTWLDGLGALDLHIQESAPANDPLLLAAAKMIKNEDYNGLSSGHGKDVIVQLVRAFAAEGYPVDPDPWLRAYFAVGGSFRHAESVHMLVEKMKTGTKHRVKQRYRENIVDLLRERLAANADVTAD